MRSSESDSERRATPQRVIPINYLRLQRRRGSNLGSVVDGPCLGTGTFVPLAAPPEQGWVVPSSAGQRHSIGRRRCGQRPLAPVRMANRRPQGGCRDEPVRHALRPCRPQPSESVDHPACKVTANSKVVRPDVKFGPPLSTLFDGRQYPAVSRPGLSAGEELWPDLSSQGVHARQYGQDYLVAVT